MTKETIIKNLKRYTQVYLGESPVKVIEDEGNQFQIDVTFPTYEQYRDFIFKTMKYKMKLDVTLGEERDVIWLIFDGYKYPVIVSFGIEDNIYDEGKISCSVWINENVKEPMFNYNIKRNDQ